MQILTCRVCNSRTQNGGCSVYDEIGFTYVHFPCLYSEYEAAPRRPLVTFSINPAIPTHKSVNNQAEQRSVSQVSTHY